jgi:hypothetical protein
MAALTLHKLTLPLMPRMRQPAKNALLLTSGVEQERQASRVPPTRPYSTIPTTAHATTSIDLTRHLMLLYGPSSDSGGARMSDKSLSQTNAQSYNESAREFGIRYRVPMPRHGTWKPPLTAIARACEKPDCRSTIVLLLTKRNLKSRFAALPCTVCLTGRHAILGGTLPPLAADSRSSALHSEAGGSATPTSGGGQLRGTNAGSRITERITPLRTSGMRGQRSILGPRAFPT